jgi:hypothetical protein
LRHQFDIVLEKRKIHLDHPIKALGEFEIELRLHPEVKATLKVKVESSNPPPAPTAEAEAKPGDKGERGEHAHREKRSALHGAQAKTEAKPADAKARPDRKTKPTG